MTDDDGNHYPLINTLNLHVQYDTSIAIIYKLLPVPFSIVTLHWICGSGMNIPVDSGCIIS